MKINKKKEKVEDSTITTSEIMREKKKNSKKTIKNILILIIFISILAGLIIFSKNKIPSKYYGSYTRYYYVDGSESKYTYKISALSVKLTYEYTSGDNKQIGTDNVEYYKKGKDLIIREGDIDKYAIIENDCLYLESSKDISQSKENGLFYWNEKSDMADLYEIENKSEGLQQLIEIVTNSWSRKLIYDAAEKEIGNLDFYIIKSDEENDKTDLNTYIVKLKASGGDLNLYYNRKEKKLERIYFSGSVLHTLYGGMDKDSMDAEDIYDCRAMLLATMYIFGSKDKENLNENISNLDEIQGLSHKTEIAFDYDNLFKNRTIDKNFEDRDNYSLTNEKYDISFINWVTSGTYSIHGILSWDISVKNKDVIF